MSKEAITKVVQRAISDAGFRRQLSTDPTGALRGFDLSADEAAALRTGDAGRLSAMGVDQRMSKAFALGGASLAATRPGGTDLSAGGVSAVSSAEATGAGGAFGNALVSGSDSSAALIDDGASGARTIIPTEPGGNISADIDGVATVRSAIRDDPDGFLAANANADASGSITRANAIKDDPDGFLAANADADLSGAQTTAFVDGTDTHLTAGYDANEAGSAMTDAHDRGDDAVTRIADDDASGGSGTANSEGGPNISS